MLDPKDRNALLVWGGLALLGEGGGSGVTNKEQPKNPLDIYSACGILIR